MPAKTPKQYGLMQAACHGNLRGMGGPPKSVACEFVHKTSPEARSRFAKALKNRKRKKSNG